MATEKKPATKAPRKTAPRKTGGPKIRTDERTGWPVIEGEVTVRRGGEYIRERRLHALDGR